MKKSKFIFCTIILFWSMSMHHLNAQCSNKMIDFSNSSTNNYIQSNLTNVNADLWVDFWIKSDATSSQSTCPTSQGELFFKVEDDPSTFVGLGECNGEIQVIFEFSGSTINLVPATNIRNGWNHIQFGLQYNPATSDFTVDLYLDCVNVYNKTGIQKFAFNKLTLGNDLTNASFPNNFEGKIDEFKMSYKKLACSAGYSCEEEMGSSIIDYLRFDEGVSAGNNTTFVGPKNAFMTGNTYLFNGFNLMGNSSNYLCSNAPIVYPDLMNATIEIKDYPFRNQILTEICSGDPVHFCLDTTYLNQIPLGLVVVNWESNSGSGWNLLPSSQFDGFCFAVAPGELVTDCSTNNLGYSDVKYRAVFKVYTDQSMTDYCVYRSQVTNLRICCEPDFQLDVKVNGTTNALCDQDNVTFDVDVSSSYPFISNLANGTTVTYSYNGTALPSFSNMTSFSWNQLVDASAGACFDATITTPCGKTKTMSSCITIDRKPKCGTIIGSSTPPNLQLVSSSPLVYEICPGNDAAIEIDQPFIDCIPHWQYSFDGISGWTDLGIGNSRQNTNILPTGWPGNKIFYRIECKPLSDPSGCDPCYSNLIEINLTGATAIGAITGNKQFCRGGSTLLTLTGHDPSATHQWYCNGNPVGTGSATLQATQAGCCWVESTDTANCAKVSTQKICTEICDIEINLKTTTCMKEGDPFTIDACGSTDSCGLPLTYEWYIDGVLSTQTTCTINGTMGASPVTYELVATNSIGCIAKKSITLTPCP